ncbi:hypothetical protein QF047_002862 [Arthrobacter sp. W4I7]|nr:hypothetical protein [Arthrobacter sp. W4I7]
MADHLEGRRTRADDHPGLEDDGIHGGVQEDLAHSLAGPHVGGKLHSLGVEPAQVDDPGHTGGGRGVGSGPRHCPFLGFKAGPGGHGMDQVVEDVDAGQGRPQRPAVVQAAFHDLHLVPPGDAGDLAGRAHQDFDRVPLVQEPGHQASADVAGGAGHQDGFAWRPGAAGSAHAVPFRRCFLSCVLCSVSSTCSSSEPRRLWTAGMSPAGGRLGLPGIRSEFRVFALPAFYVTPQELLP